MPATTPVANEAVGAARQRRVGAAQDREVRIEWFIQQVVNKVSMSMKQRVMLITHMLKDQVVRNISTAVTKGTGPRGGRVVTGRSKPGGYPHADTTLLLKTIFEEVREVQPGVYEGYVGTPLDYGLILETRMDRSFLVRTHREMLGSIRGIMIRPIT